MVVDAVGGLPPRMGPLSFVHYVFPVAGSLVVVPFFLFSMFRIAICSRSSIIHLSFVGILRIVGIRQA